MTVRARLTVTVAAAIALTAVLFAGLSVAGADRALRASFDQRLLTMAQALAASVDVHKGRVSVDASDLANLATLHAGVPYAIFGANDALVAGEQPPGNGGVHVVTAPIERAGHDYGTVAVWASNQWIADFDRTTALVSTVVALLLMVAGTLVSRRVVGAALAPLDRVATLAERIEARDLSQRLDADGTDELGRLCSSFDRMLDRLEAAFSRERRFSADASHELRAPLAVLCAETELALRRERSPGEYRAALESIAREAQRLEDLIDELLAAARSDIDAHDLQTLDAGVLAREIGARVEPAAKLRQVEVRVESDAHALARANRATIERAVLAIVYNAIDFARDGGTVRLRVAHDAGDGVRIDVADDGPGFSPEALEHATERFWRGDAARPRGGTGLGLAIARTMVEANGGRLRLRNAAGGGAVVSISLEAAFT